MVVGSTTPLVYATFTRTIPDMGIPSSPACSAPSCWLTCKFCHLKPSILRGGGGGAGRLSRHHSNVHVPTMICPERIIEVFSFFPPMYKGCDADPPRLPQGVMMPDAFKHTTKFQRNFMHSLLLQHFHRDVTNLIPLSTRTASTLNKFS